MPNPRPYRAPWWLPGGHLQTIYPYLFLRNPVPSYRRERIETPDGDFIDLDWVDASRDVPTVVLFHGLEGGSRSHYARNLLRAVSARGWRGVVAHFRGCSGMPNRLRRAYHSGDADEIDWILRLLKDRTTNSILAVGVSLGGNALLKWLAREGQDANEVIAAASAISAPIDLMVAGHRLGSGINRFYGLHFLRTLKPKAREKLVRFPEPDRLQRIQTAYTLSAFDDAFTAPVHGFKDVNDYWTRASTIGELSNIVVPTLLVHARNDPFLPGNYLPAQRHTRSAVEFEFTEHGGHVGFVSGSFPGNLSWLPQRVLGFLGQHLARETQRPSGKSAPQPNKQAPETSFNRNPLRGTNFMLPAKQIFKAYDIRGIVGDTLTVDSVTQIGHAIGSEAIDRGCDSVCIGRDGRLSGPELSGALARGLQQAGIKVIDIGQVTTPMLYFAAHHFGTGSGVMVTGSHNPPNYNGLKMMLAGDTLSGEQIAALRERIEQGRLLGGEGSLSERDIGDAYLQRVTSDIVLARPMRIAIDCGNGVAGGIAPDLYRQLGCEVEELFCEVDGTFPNHHPDPSQPKNLSDLIQALRDGDAEIGLAFDGDGDRLGVVTREGKIIFPDRQLMLFAADVLSRNPGAEILYDVKCTGNLAPWISKHGGKPTMWKTGHSLIKAQMKKSGAPLAGEMSGHVFFGERWYGFDDGVYAGARLLEYLSKQDDISAVFEALPDSVNTPELQIEFDEGENHAFIATLQETAEFPGASNVISIDGLRVEYPDGFGLARASNTTPVVVLRFEGNDEAAIERIKTAFRQTLLRVKPDAKLPF
jgi:phosphomannomutase / phosphoglucomutase